MRVNDTKKGLMLILIYTILVQILFFLFKNKDDFPTQPYELNS